MDSCTRTGLLFDEVVASVELVNSSRLQVQCTHAVPTVAIDKCDGVQVLLLPSFFCLCGAFALWYQVPLVPAVAICVYRVCQTNPHPD